MVFCYVILTLTLTLTLPVTLTNPNPNANANPINVYNIHKNEWHNERHNAPPVERNVEIRLLFLPVFVAHGLKVRLPVFVATSKTKTTKIVANIKASVLRLAIISRRCKRTSW